MSARSIIQPISKSQFIDTDPHLTALSQMKYQHQFTWWQGIDLDTPGIYLLTGGRQVGKSTSCKQLIAHCLEKESFKPANIAYLTCDEIYDPQTFSQILRSFLDETGDQHFLLVIDEVTFVENWDRVIKALADEGQFRHGICLLTGSDSIILKEAVMRFPGRRGEADQTDFHLHPLSFKKYLSLVNATDDWNKHFQDFLKCGGYLRAINDLAKEGFVKPATYQTYEQWVRGDFIKHGKREGNLLALLEALLNTGVSQISYSRLSQKVGSIGKDTCIAYCDLLERMDVLMNLQAFDQNTRRGFPKKERKFHFKDPFIAQAIYQWVQRESGIEIPLFESQMVEATVASHLKRIGKTYYFKGKGEVDLIWLNKEKIIAAEVKWTNQVRPTDLKTLKQFHNKLILSKHSSGLIEGIEAIPVAECLKGLPQ